MVLTLSNYGGILFVLIEDRHFLVSSTGSTILLHFVPIEAILDTATDGDEAEEHDES